MSAQSAGDTARAKEARGTILSVSGPKAKHTPVASHAWAARAAPASP